MYIPAIFLGAAVVGETGVATGILDAGSAAANLGAAGILGAVAIAAIIGMVKLYNDSKKDTAETIELLHTTVKENTDVLRQLKENCTKRLSKGE
jgi:hypothetical protein